jgi:hypothetical protein
MLESEFAWLDKDKEKAGKGCSWMVEVRYCFHLLLNGKGGNLA